MKLLGNGYKGEEKRKAPIVVKFSLAEYSTFLVPTILAILWAAVWWGSMNTKTEALAKTDGEFKIQIEKNTELNRKQNEVIVGMERDITHTKKDVGEIKTTMTEILKEVRKKQ